MFGNFQSDTSCYGFNIIESMKLKLNDDSYINNFYNDVTVSQVDFNLEQDILVLLNIPETSSSVWQFHLWKDLTTKFDDSEKWTPICFYHYLFKTYMCTLNHGGKPIIKDSFIATSCYTHLGFSELSNCLEKKIKDTNLELMDKTIFHFITFIRNPIDRYIDEYQKIIRGNNFVINFLMNEFNVFHAERTSSLVKLN